jgi:RND family efflux transporter MFP subunit
MAARPGAYLNAGDLATNVGQLEKVRVRVHVDEPELGRVATGRPVTITWDALPGRVWKGAVEKLPTEIVALGTRQIGEVVCAVDNPDGGLLPGTNINAEILSEAVDNALTIPKESLRRASNEAGVYVLEGDRIVWRKISLGASSITRAQVLEGLQEGDSVALPANRPLAGGMAVRPVYP